MNLSSNRPCDDPDLVAVHFSSCGDGSDQPAIWQPPAEPGMPLVVGLHPWSADYRSDVAGEYAEHCRQRGWAMIFPDFRGRNKRPQACGSGLVVADVISAAAFGVSLGLCDGGRVFLLGGSGGGHCSLLLAGRAPSLWAGVSAWVPISDLCAWHAESLHRGNRYGPMIEASCGGRPDAGTAAHRQALLRSPLTWLAQARDVPLDINAGINDGHSGSVPVSHSLRAFNTLADPASRLSDEQIDYFVRQQAPPPELRAEDGGGDDSYGGKRVLFRRCCRNVRLTIFDGGHEQIVPAAMSFLEGLGRRPDSPLAAMAEQSPAGETKN